MKANMNAMKGQMTMMMEAMMRMNKMMKESCEDFRIQHHDWRPYWPKMNNKVEAANMNKMMCPHFISNCILTLT